MRRFLVASDVIAVVAASLCASMLVANETTAISARDHLVVIALSIPLMLGVLYALSLYHLSERHIDQTLAEELGPVAIAVAVWSWATMLLSSAASETPFKPAWFALSWIAATVLLLFGRVLMRRITRSRDWYRQNVLVVGGPSDTNRVLRRIKRHPEWGLDPVETGIGTAARLSPADVLGVARNTNAVRVILADWNHTVERRTELIRTLVTNGVHVDIVSGEPEALLSGATLHQIEGLPIMTIRPVRISRTGRIAKRGTDIAIAGIALVGLLPLLAYIAIRIKFDSKGPVIHRQPRIGQNRATFEIYKFRTMVANADQLRGDLRDGTMEDELFKLKVDPRVTRYGTILRRRSLDELPQLFNVLRGEMSVVGPRPLPLDEAHLAVDHFAERTSFRPGITGPWQVHGRSDIPFEDMVKLDYAYVSTWSMHEDFRVLIRTIRAVLTGRGAY